MTTGAYFNAGLVFPRDRFRPWNPFATGTSPANRARGPVQVQFEGCAVHRLFTIGGAQRRAGMLAGTSGLRFRSSLWLRDLPHTKAWIEAIPDPASARESQR